MDKLNTNALDAFKGANTVFCAPWEQHVRCCIGSASCTYSLGGPATTSGTKESLLLHHTCALPAIYTCLCAASCTLCYYLQESKSLTLCSQALHSPTAVVSKLQMASPLQNAAGSRLHGLQCRDMLLAVMCETQSSLQCCDRLPAVLFETRSSLQCCDRLLAVLRPLGKWICTTYSWLHRQQSSPVLATSACAVQRGPMQMCGQVIWLHSMHSCMQRPRGRLVVTTGYKVVECRNVWYVVCMCLQTPLVSIRCACKLISNFM